jgi:hypothetical protein
MTLHKVPYILVDGNIDVMKLQLMMLELQSQGRLEIIVIDSDLQGSLVRKSAHLHSCTALPRVIVDLGFLGFGLILCTAIRVRLDGIGGRAFLGHLITVVRQ